MPRSRVGFWRRDPENNSLGGLPIRINVTGNAGAGKTTLAAELGDALGLSVHSLDSVVWRSGWKKTPPDERLAAERELVAGPAWVIDGVSSTVREASDLILFLDVPRYLCAWRGLSRSVRYLNRTRPEMPAGCPEWRIVPQLLRIIRHFPSRAGLVIRQEAAKDPGRYRIIRDADQAKMVVRNFPAVQHGAADASASFNRVVVGCRGTRA